MTTNENKIKCSSSGCRSPHVSGYDNFIKNNRFNVILVAEAHM